MGFAVQISDDAVSVTLDGWDRVVNWRRRLAFHPDSVVEATVKKRSDLESHIDHRALGFGTHNGSKRPNRRRVGTMLGREVAGNQFWAVPAGEPGRELLVLELRRGDFKRVVLAVDEPGAAAAAIEQLIVR